VHVTVITKQTVINHARNQTIATGYQLSSKLLNLCNSASS